MHDSFDILHTPLSEWGQGIACLELGRVDVARKYITHITVT